MSFIGQNFGGGSSAVVVSNGDLNSFLENGYFTGPLVSQDDYTTETGRALNFTFEDETFEAVTAVFGLLKPGRQNAVEFQVETTPTEDGLDLECIFQLTGAEWNAVSDGSYLYSVTLIDASGNRVTRLHSAAHPNPYKYVAVLRNITNAVISS